MKMIYAMLLWVLALSTWAFIAVRDIINELGIKHSNAQSYILKNLVGNFDTAPIGSDAVEDAEEVL